MFYTLLNNIQKIYIGTLEVGKVVAQSSEIYNKDISFKINGVFANTTTSTPDTTIILNRPTLFSGDLLIAIIMGRYTPSVIPTNWTFYGKGLAKAGLSQQLFIYTKIATSSEPDSYTWEFSNNTVNAGIIVAVQNGKIDHILESYSNARTCSIDTLQNRLNISAFTWIYNNVGTTTTTLTRTGTGTIVPITDQPIDQPRLIGAYTTDNTKITHTIVPTEGANSPNHNGINIKLRQTNPQIDPLPEIIGSSINSDSTSDTSHTLDTPIHKQDDLLVAIIMWRGATPSDITAPTGWSFFGGPYVNNLNFGQRLFLYTKTADLNESLTHTWTGPSNRNAGFMCSIRNGAIGSVFETSTKNITTSADRLNLVAFTWVYANTSGNTGYSLTGNNAVEITDSPRAQARIAGAYTKQSTDMNIAITVNNNNLNDVAGICIPINTI